MGNTDIRYTLSLNDILTSKLAQADQQAKKFDDTMSGVQNTVNKVGAAFGIALGLQGIKNAGAAIIDAGTTVENAQTGLTTLLKDSGKAKEVIQNTMQDAKTTPFAFEGLLSANKALISANASAGEARSTVLDLSNAIAATGGGDNELQRMVVNLQQIRNTGKATAMDIRQFAFAGINIYQLLANATGKPIEKVKELDVSYNLLRYALYKAHQEGGLYANGLENMANNTSVQISNLGDSMFQLSVKIFNDLKPAITSLLATGQEAIKWLESAWEWLKRNRETIMGVAQGVLYGVAAFKLYQTWVRISVLWTKIQAASSIAMGEAFVAANTATRLLTGGMQMLEASMMANPAGLVLVGISLLASAYFAFKGNAEDATRANNGLNDSLFQTGKQAKQTAEEFVASAFTKVQAASVGTSAERMAEMDRMINKEIERRRKLAPFENRTGDILGPIKAAEEDAKKLRNWRQTIKTAKKVDGVPVLTSGDVALKQTSKVTGNRSISVNIHIDELIHEFNVKTTTINESASKIAEKVTQTLLSAVNDSQVVAGQNS
jgi:tape measure domain-containing protein